MKHSTHEKLVVTSGITHLKINRLNEHRFSKNRYSLEEEEEEEGSKKGGTRDVRRSHSREKVSSQPPL